MLDRPHNQSIVTLHFSLIISKIVVKSLIDKYKNIPIYYDKLAELDKQKSKKIAEESRKISERQRKLNEEAREKMKEIDPYYNPK